MVDKLAAGKQLKRREGKAFLDLDKLGYQKLLAAGKITKPVLVKVATHSEGAAKKVEEAGGQILGVTEEKSEGAEETSAKG